MFAHIAAAVLALVPCEHHVDFSGWKGGANARYGIVVTTCAGKRHASEVELFDGSNAEDACSTTRAVLEAFKVPFRAVGKEGFVIEPAAKSGIRSIQFVPKGWAPLVTVVPVVPKAKADPPPVQIDFAPLPIANAMVEYKLRVELTTADGKGIEQNYKVGKGNAPADVAALVEASLPDGFEAKLDGTVLGITSFGGKPITKARVVALDLPKGAPQPVVVFNPPKKK